MSSFARLVVLPGVVHVGNAKASDEFNAGGSGLPPRPPQLTRGRRQPSPSPSGVRPCAALAHSPNGSDEQSARPGVARYAISGHENKPEGSVRVSDYGPGTRF